MKRLHFVVTGRVQGVGFRYFCYEEATRLGLTGYARNLRDGSVEIEAEGDEQALDEFAASLTRGPRAAKVENVSQEERDLKHETTFSVG
jgi:acylphosphatase